MPLFGNAGLLASFTQLRNLATDAGLDRRVRQAGLLLEATVKRNASGRPGPNVITGNYRRSWNTQRVINAPGADVAYSVGTNAPQGRRLEFGFRDVDILNRRYNQPAFPHLEPAFVEVEDEMVEIIATRVDEIIGGATGLGIL